MRRATRWIAAVGLGAQGVVLAAGACSVDDLDLTGKRCPCVAGFVCDTTTDTCVPSGTIDGAVPDGFVPDRAIADAGNGKIVVYNLRPTWTTANGIRWDWQALGERAEFEKFVIVTGPTAEAVRARSSATTELGPNENPELGIYSGRVTGDAQPPLSLWSVSDGHKEGATIFAQVLAYDKAGGTTSSDVASAQTSKPKAVLPIFDNQLLDGGTPSPADFDLSTKNTYPDGGGSCLERPVACAGGAPSCAQEVGVAGYNGRTLTALDTTDFDGAFLEIAIRGRAPAGSFNEVVLALGADNCGDPCRMRQAGWFFRTKEDEWRLVQVPLKNLRRNDGAGAALNFQELQNRNYRVNGFFLGGTWSNGATIAVDNVRVRW
jgi:hypothetical protein